MRIVVYGPEKRTGALKGDKVIDLSRACTKYLREKRGERHAFTLGQALVPPDLLRLIESGPRALDDAEASLEHLSHAADDKDHRGESVVYDAAKVKIHPPRPNGTRVACAGSNFSSHRERMARRNSRDAKPFIWGFWTISDPIGNDDEVTYPARCDRLDYEGEAAIILSRGGKDLKPDDLKNSVWGITLYNDWSIRSPREPLGPMNFAVPKNWDTSWSLGPAIAVREFECNNIDIETYVNNERRQKHNTGEMTFSFAQYLEYLSRDLTLKPGDVIASGTGEGTAADASPVGPDGVQPPDLFLKVGDVVEVRSPQLGSLRNKVVAKKAK
jgi:2-keto-4-pentenoate hydratase/2-oxohepta-3-ene-1,7-dioic acid hydratase in catechol pathway